MYKINMETIRLNTGITSNWRCITKVGDILNIQHQYKNIGKFEVIDFILNADNNNLIIELKLLNLHENFINKQIRFHINTCDINSISNTFKLTIDVGIDS